MDSDLIELMQIRQADAPFWGNKASALGELWTRGFPIPPGICVSIQKFRQAAPAYRVSPELDASLCSASVSLLQAAPFLAVRSSAAAEDLPGTSYAGLYQSVIGVSAAAQLGAAVETVWRSYTAPAALAARSAAGSEDAPGGMGVLIQAGIQAEVAGVCYSVDPVHPGSGRLVISACWGLGAGVADGSVPADTLWVSREDLEIVEKRIVEKDACFSVGESGLVRSLVSGTQRRAACLPEDWARRIAEFALSAEQVFGVPQDLEWAIAGGKVWILQSRPIASLKDHAGLKALLFPVNWAQPEDARRAWYRWTFGRQGTAPLLPLDIDYLRLLDSTRLETCLALGADRNQDLRMVNGQLYTSPAPLPLSKADLRIRQQASDDLQLRLINEGRTSWDHWGPEIERANARLTQVDLSTFDSPRLADFLEEAMAARSRHNMLHPMMNFKPGQPYFAAFRSITGQSGAEAESAAYRLLESPEAGESPLIRLIDALYHLAEEARAFPELTAWLRETASQSGDELTGFPAAAEGAANWLAQFNSFIQVWGDRNGDGYGSEALLSTPSWRDQPRLPIQRIVQFLDPRMEPPSVQRKRSLQAANAAADALCAQCADTDAESIAEFRKQLHTARRMQAVVELHNHHIEQIGLGQLRRAVLAASVWLQSEEVFGQVEDVFWLNFSEILEGLREPGHIGRAALAEIIRARREQYQEWAQCLWPPLTLGLPPSELPPRPVDADAVTASTPVGASEKAREIHGVGASAGIVRGHARVIQTWQPDPQIQPGDILVAENAGPLWMPFFPILGGMVLESGSLGQHAASTAREYGIPAVISAAHATRIIQDGDWISLDGAQGIVRF